MAYLVDTNVISEFRKGKRGNPGVFSFFTDVDPEDIFLPVQVIGEIRSGITKVRRNGQVDRALAYQAWLAGPTASYGIRIIDFDADDAQIWGVLIGGVKKDPHTIDKQIAAIALGRDLTVVSRDSSGGFAHIPGLKFLNPFLEAGP